MAGEDEDVDDHRGGHCGGAWLPGRFWLLAASTGLATAGLKILAIDAAQRVVGLTARHRHRAHDP